MGALADELLKKGSTALNKLSILIILHLHVLYINSEGDFFGDSRNVAARPAQNELFLESFKLVEPTLAGELSLGILACHSVLHNLANFDWITDHKCRRNLLSLALMLLHCPFGLLTLRVESQNFLNKVGLGIISSKHKVLGTD